MKILVAEDDSGYAMILREMLTRIGHVVTMTGNGIEAWEALQRESFPLVITDWMMPEMDGASLCGKIRERMAEHYTYIILLTSRTEFPDRLVGLFSGADDFLAKHSGQSELLARLEIAKRILEVQEKLQRLITYERNISTQLQAALTPAIPKEVPGMALTSYYEAALEEARVGGDFYDVYLMTRNRTTLIVGDVSGKGLAAAQQVATVRNMLRYSLYRSRTLVGAVQSLNKLLAEQRILQGFATLFVGVYEASGKLRYINCGQEPALVRRATGDVEFLGSTGAVLGSMEDATYEEGQVTLGRGDALAIFTDGLTDAGWKRGSMLGVDGLAEALNQALNPQDASSEAVALHSAQCLIAAVDTAINDSVRQDDLCLLLGVAQ